jgi:uncharacterized membrane protein
MYLKDILRLSEWKIIPLLFIVILLQAMFLTFTVLNLHIPMISELISIALLLFIPGVLLLRILNFENIKSSAEMFIYSIGSSVAIVMFTGFIINSFYPLFGMVKPLSNIPVVITMNIIIYILCLTVYWMDKKDPNRHNIEAPNVDLKLLTSPPFLVLLIIPFLSIFGTYFMNYYNNNILLMIMILIIGLIVFLIASGKYFTKNLYPLAVFVISISLILHNSLISTYIWGWDISLEYYIANQIIGNGIWMVANPNNYNSMLSVVILAPMLSIFSGINLVWVMKIVYPFIFSIMPVGLYFIFKKQTTPLIAFLSVFLVVLMFTFYTEMLAILREMVAELFLALLILLLVSENLDIIKRGILGVLFGTSIIISHYGIAYIMLFGFSFVLITTAILKTKLYFKLHSKFIEIKNGMIQYAGVMNQFNFLTQFNMDFLDTAAQKEENIRLSVRIENYKDKINGRNHMEGRMLTLFFVGFFVVFLFTWYIYTSDGSTFSTFLSIGNNIAANIASIMDSKTSQGLNIVLTQQSSLLRSVHKDFYLISQFFILVGIIIVLLNMDRMKFKRDYKIFSIFAFLLLVSGLLIPYFASEMNTTRLYHVSLLFLAPITIIGMLKSTEISSRIMNVNIKSKTIIQVISIFLIGFMIFDTGLVYQFLGNGDTIAMSLSDKVDFPKLNQNDVASAQWLRNNYDHDDVVYSDTLRSSILQSFYSASNEIPPYDDLIQNKSYVYLSTFNVATKNILITKMSGANIMQQSYVSPDNILQNRSKIYDNGGSYIYGEKMVT